MRGDKGKILVIRGGAIGDFILTLPVFTALRNHFPEALLEVLGYPHIARIAQLGGLVDRVEAIEARGLAGFFARNGELSADLQDYFSEFDLIISYLYDPDDFFKANVRRSLRGQFIQGPHRPNESEREHAAKVFLKPLERLAIFGADPVPRLNLSPRTSNLTPLLALHPGSGSEYKNWPEKKWSELLTTLAAKAKYDFLIVGGEVEGEKLQRLAAKLSSNRVEVAQSLPLNELASRLQSCAAFVGHDSGISHLAAALGLPSLILWAHTPEEIWSPQGKVVRVIRETGGVKTINVERVRRELDVLLSVHG